MSSAQDMLSIAGKDYHSRLLVGSGKYKDLAETRLATEASGAEIITVAIRRTNIGQNADEPNLLDVVPPDRYTILPNTAGCFNAKEAVRTCQLARELLDGHNLVKLEVLADQKTLFPHILETLKATEILVEDVVITDLDLAFGTAGLNFNQDAATGIAEALGAPDRVDDVLIDRLLTKCSERLSLLAASIHGCNKQR